MRVVFRKGFLSLLASLLFLSNCSVDSVKNRYLFAEKLWSDGNYSEAVVEFDRVHRRDSESDLGKKALLRSAMTQTLFLNQHDEALRKLRLLIETEGDSDLSWEARKQVGEILFTRLEDHRASIKHYEELIQARPKAPEVAEFHYKIAVAYFQGWAFDDALGRFALIPKQWPASPWAEKAAYQIGMVWLTRGEQRPGAEFNTKGKEVYQEVIRVFDRFLALYPKSRLVPQAHFGRAVALEELDQLEAALSEYEKVQTTYPTPQVVQIRLIRVRERISKRRR